VHLVGFLFIVVIADARKHEPEIREKPANYDYSLLSQTFRGSCDGSAVLKMMTRWQQV
jgi:hypothetical protein